MKFSDQFQITLGRDDNWFDPVLTMDTHLFLDPFLLYASEEGHFAGSHQEVVSFFNSVFQMISRSQGNSTSLYWKRAVNLLQFPEVEEICLGYTDAGTKGSGSGIELAHVIASLLWEAIRAGLTEIRHFEEVCILGEGIGADRISDITATLIRRRLAAYTREICESHNVPMNTANYLRGYYNETDERWMPLEISLPTNPYNRKPILLVPRNYLRSLPTINPDDFWEYCYTNENETLRIEYSADVTRRVDKRTIVSFARRHPEIRSHYVGAVEERQPQPYDLERDPKGLIQWYNFTGEYCRRQPLALVVASKSDFCNAIDKMVEEFRNYVENNEGWGLLWNDNRTSRSEGAAQRLFLGIIKHYCKANDIDISREANIGRGPVDFKVSQGYQLRALIELKLARNTRFWNGLERQLPMYQEAEGVDRGYFVVVAYSDDDLRKLSDIQGRVRNVNSTTSYEVKCVIVDARWHPLSASRL